jgi:ABC-2 type transport system permease protein
MGHTFQVFSYELLRSVRRRRYLFTTFGIPLIALALLVGYQFISSRTASNPDENDAAQDLVEQLDFSNVGRAGYVDQSGRFNDPGELASILTRYPDEAAAQAALNAGEIGLYYVIAADYLETGDVTTVQPRLNLGELENGPVQRLVLNGLSQGVDPQIFERLVEPSHIQVTNLTLVGGEDRVQDEGGSFLLVYVFAIVLMFSLFTTSGYLMQSVIEEKETRLIEILISTVRPGQLLAGKILAMGLVGLIQLVAWLGALLLAVQIASGGAAGQIAGVLATIANLQIPPNVLPALVFYFILAYFLFAGLFAIVGALSNSMREGPQYAVIFTLPAALPLYFISLIADSPEGPIPTALSIFPLTAPITMAARLVIAQVPFWQVLVSLLLLGLTAAVVMWLAGRVFRVQVLLAGQMPKLKDLPRLLRS